ncbi:MAG TPA: M28 family peptidase [Gemmatimonadales bacterium]
MTAVVLSATHAAAQTAPKTAHPAPRSVWPDEESPMKWAPRPTVAAITANDLRTRLYQLADDSMQGRRIGEIGDYKATTYIAAEFKRLGLKPGGDNGGYFQELDFGPLGFDSTSATLAVGGMPLERRRDWIPIAPTATNGASGSAALHDVPVVFAGRWGEQVPLDPASFRGKIAVFIAPETGGGRGRGAGGGAGGGATCPAGAGFPNQRGAADALALAAATTGRGGGGAGRGGGGVARDSRAATAGAAGVILVEDSIARNTANMAFGTRQAMKPELPSGGLPSATISAAAAAKLFGKSVDQLTPGMSGQSVSGSWNYEWHKSVTPGRNVIGILPGSNPALAGEYVLLSAHNDHIGVNPTAVDHDSLRAYNQVMRPQGANDRVSCPPTPLQQHLIDSMIRRARSIRPPRRDSINNGAEDDGSGTVILLEVVEKFASEHPHPARSLIFVSHTGEEAGLLGSAWFTSHPTIPLDSIVAANNMDMDSRGRTTDVKFGGPHSIQTLGSRRESKAFGDIIDSVNALSPAPMAIDRSWDVTANPSNRFCRSDQVNYVHHNVPVTYYSTGYYEDYHQVTDEPEYIDYNHGARVGQFMHDIMTALANRKDKPAIDGPDPTYPACR